MSNRRRTVVEPLEPAQRAAWDRFVEAHPDGSFFHLSGWKPVLESAFGHRVHLLAAWHGGDLAGVLPLVELRNRIFGRALVSTAFCVYGGPLVLDGEARGRLDEAAIALGERLGVNHLEYRLRAPAREDWVHRRDLYATFRKAISADHDANMKAIPRKQRAMVRKAIGLGLRSRIDPAVDTFYRLYAESVRNLGTPVFARRYLRLLQKEFARSCEVLVVSHEGRPVSGVMSFYFREEVLPYYGGGIPAARELAANDFMYWEVMRRAAERGCRLFDFGRSKLGTGAYAFKKNWGFAPQPLSYEYRLIRGQTVPDTNPLNPKYQHAIATWKRLPVWLATSLGPIIARELG